MEHRAHDAAVRPQVVMQAIIAETKIELGGESGTGRLIHLYIRAPFDQHDGSWGCYCNIAGEWEKELCIYGEDSFQALCLTITFLRMQVQQMLVRDGARSIHGEVSDLTYIDAMFGQVDKFH